MPLNELVANANPARDDVQQTDFGYDVIPRYICNNWQEITAAQGPGAYPFDVVIIGAGMFGGYCAEKLYRRGGSAALRILLLDAGAFLLQSHIQNLPQQLGGKVGGPNYLRARDDASGAQNVVWGMPWISNEVFPGLAYSIGGRSLFWGGWSPPLTPADLASWPSEVATYLNGAAGYAATAAEIGTAVTTDFITHTALFNAMLDKAQAALPLSGITEAGEAPLAVVGSAPRSGLFAFDKFSSAPFIMDAIRNDVGVNGGGGDARRRIFLVPRTQVHRLNLSGTHVSSLDMSVAGVRQQLALAPGCAVILANSTIEATRLALESLGIGSQQFGSPRVGNLMAHLRSNITVRIKRTALGLGPPADLETVALIARGTALGRRFHHQITAADIAGPNPESAMWSMVPDVDVIGSLLTNQDPNWVAITFRGIGEMEDQQTVANIDPARSWLDLSNETDRWGMRRAYAHLVATQNDQNLWAAMDQSAFDLALALAGSAGNIEYWNGGQWQAAPLQPDANGRRFWRDTLGTTHHEAGTLFMGAPGASITDTNGKFHGTDNAYVAGPALFPTLGSANPSLTAFSLARRTVNAIVAATTQSPATGFAPLSLAPADWQIVKQPNSPATMIHYGSVLETSGWYGLYWYVKEQFSNFILSLEWRISRREENSGVYIRIPAPTAANALQAADTQGHEIQIDQRGFDSVTGTEGHSLKMTGAIYDLQAPSVSTQVPIGVWNRYIIEANGPRIQVTLNGQLVNDYQSSREQTGYIALQMHDFMSRTQFRNLLIRKLP
ncbi:MAG: Glucosemethanolcholine oxidoreductaseNAD binding site [Rubritepida sp.]|nr:Glucosemethanolcholine oxidoreductaseNAD binding site [Rubritepida sp.]